MAHPALRDMKTPNYLGCVCVLSLTLLFGCKDPNQPSTLAQQRNLMNGTYKPTKDQLSAAMSHIHLPSPPKGGAPKAPGSNVPPPANP